MKRLLSVILLAVLIAGLLLSMVGCGGDTKQAKEYMKEADKLSDKVESSMGELQSELSGAFTNVSDVESYKAAVAGVKEITGRLMKESEEAVSAYEKIDSLKGVDDYKEYANLKIEAGETFQEMLKTTDDFLDELEKMVVDGTITDEIGNSMLETFEADMADLTDTLEKADEKADALKSEKKL